MDDKNIVEGLKKRDNESFIELVNSYKRKVVSLCYSYTQDYHEAEDLSQEVFISIFKCIENFRGDCSLSTYIYKVSLSRCMDYKRKKSIKNFLSGLFNYEKSDQNYSEIDERNYVRSLILNLPEELKKVIVLYYYVGLSQKEIAEILNVTEKAVEGRIYRAKQKLKLEFEKEGKVECSKNGII